MGKYHSKELFEAIEQNNINKVKKIIKSTKNKFEQTSNANGQTPLQLASKNGYSEIVKILLQNGFGANIPDGSCWFPLHHACAGGHITTLQTLTSEDLGDNKANINNHCVVNSCKCQKQTALHVACLNGYHNCVIVLLTLGADLTIKDKQSRTPYDIAVKNKRQDISDFMKPFLSVQKSNNL